MTVLRLTALVALLGTAACGGAYYQGLSGHTVATGPDQEMDVVWVLENNKRVLRCAPTAQGPVCTRAEVN